VASVYGYSLFWDALQVCAWLMARSEKAACELRKQKFLQDADSLGLEQLDDRRALEKLAALEATGAFLDVA
jgi:hypothetical protein